VIWAGLAFLRRVPEWVWPVLAGALLLGSVWLATVQRDAARAERDEWKAKHAIVTARLDQVEESDRVHRGHLARVEAEAARWRQIAEDLEAMEGADAPLSPYLRSVLDRVR